MKKKKIVLPAMLLLTLLLAGCAPTLKINGNEKASQNNNESEGPDKSTICSGMCSNIGKICQEDISNGEIQGRNLKNGILDETSCLLMCEADWDDSVLNCIDGADTCSQFLDDAPYCIENEDNDDESVATQAPPTDCDQACKNYVKCVSYGDDIGESDKIDAYNTCKQVCPTWTNESRSCLARTAINLPSDCATQTACMLGSVRELMNR